MSSALATVPLRASMAGFRRFSVDEYHRLIEVGVLTEDDNLELLDGYLVLKMSRNPPHDGTLDLVHQALLRVLPEGCWLRMQQAVTFGDSEPEPDFAVVRGTARSYLTKHPIASDVHWVIEVANTTLLSDRADKCSVYARAGIPIYWIVNLIERQIEVYALPSGPSLEPRFAQRRDYRAGDRIPLVLEGNVVNSIQVDELLP